MRIVGVSTGVVREKRAGLGVRRYLPGGWSTETLPVNVFAVDHPAGLCVFDAGQTARASLSGYLPGWHPFLRLARFELDEDDEAAPQLEDAGFAAAGTRWVALSHLHTDHVGGIGAFSGAEVLVSEVEWGRSTGLAGRLRGYLPQHWPDGVVPRLIETSGPPVGPFTGSYDVAGDGALLIVPTPGHTPGHLSMLVDDGERRVLLAGDLVHRRSDLAAQAPSIATWCDENGVQVLAAHDRSATSQERM